MFFLVETEMEIFRAWLRKVIKTDKNLVIDGKRVPAKILARRLQISEAALTGYHSGRKNQKGVRTFPKIPQTIQQEILRLTGTSREEMLRIGKLVLKPSPPQGELVSMTDPRIDRRVSPDNLSNLARLRRRALEFDNQILGTQLVQSLIEIEKIDPVTLKEFLDILQVKIKYLRDQKSQESNHQEK
ncbi:MAG: hypothetical protein AB1Z81_06800 [Desulfotignum sp.]